MITSAILKRPYHLVKGILANMLYGFPSKSLKIIAVTGTDGKTTTSTLIYHILKTAGKKVALISTVAAYIGDEEIDTGFHVTSPDEFSLQKLLKRIKDEKFTYVVLESTSHGIYQHRLFGITPDISLLTNITHEHLDYHKTFNAYLSVKASLLQRSKISVINKDDGSYEKVKDLLSKSKTQILTYDEHTLIKSIKEKVIKRFPEHYNILNASGVYVLCHRLGITDEAIAKGIASFGQIPGRMQEIKNNKGIRIIVDFAHTPNALKQALKALRTTTPKGGRLIAVFGSAGLRDATKRPLMGDVASSLCDEVVLTAEDPRTEDVSVIIRQIKEGVKENFGHVHEVNDRKQAIEFALNTLSKEGDTVAIFGKGHEKSMNMDGVHEIPWSDQDTVNWILSQRTS